MERILKGLPSAGLVITALCVGLSPGARAQAASRQTISEVVPGAPLFIVHKNLHALNLGITNKAGAAPSDAQCLGIFGVHCYSPQQMRHAYGIDALIGQGFDGAGETIVIVDSFGSPTIERDLAVFDEAYGLPPPPSFRIVAPLGNPPFELNQVTVGWALETTLDVEWAHAMAPRADIVLLVSPVAETEGVQGLPEFLFLEQFALDHHLGSVISQSWGATENTLFDHAGEEMIAQFERFYQRAKEEKVTVFASSGDTGAANFDVDGGFFPFPTVLYPASSPFVTGVGGTSLFLDADGTRLGEVTWSLDELGFGATGGGISQQFSLPDFQRHLPQGAQLLLHAKRGVPDVAFNANPETGVSIFLSFTGLELFIPIGGTSAGSPQWAGIVADLNQFAGRPAGFLNDRIYKLGRDGKLATLFHDITDGSNGIFIPGFLDVPGFDAAAGWDAVTGWGTPAGSTALLRALAGEADDD